jgi:hypothetical protein
MGQDYGDSFPTETPVLHASTQHGPKRGRLDFRAISISVRRGVVGGGDRRSVRLSRGSDRLVRNVVASTVSLIRITGEDGNGYADDEVAID